MSTVPRSRSLAYGPLPARPRAFDFAMWPSFVATGIRCPHLCQLRIGCSMFRFFEHRILPTAPPPPGVPPRGLVAFYWHFIRQAKGLFVALFFAGLRWRCWMRPSRCSSAASCPGLDPRARQAAARRRGRSCSAWRWSCCWRPAGGAAAPEPDDAERIAANVTNLVRWQSHWHVVRQGWTFFQNDFAGRIAARVMQTGPALRESVVLSILGIWYILVYGAGARPAAGLGRLAAGGADHRLVRRSMSWCCASFLPQMRERSREACRRCARADRQDRRQLHQHPDRQAVRPGPRRGRVRPRGGRRAHRDVPPPAAHGHAVGGLRWRS